MIQGLVVYGINGGLPGIFDGPVACGGINWTEHLSGGQSQWQCVAFCPTLGASGRLVAVGQPGSVPDFDSVMTSDDGGTTWTIQGDRPEGFWFSVIWVTELNLFVAVGSMVPFFGYEDTTGIMTSPDGITWTQRDSPDAEVDVDHHLWTSVVWSPELALLVAVSQSTGNAARPLVMTSPDAVNWTLQDSPDQGDGYWNNVTWSARLGKFFVCGWGNFDFPHIMSSANGSDWANATIPDSDNFYTAIVDSPTVGRIVAVSTAGAGVDNHTIYSDDGITWAIGSIPPGIADTFQQEYYAVCWASGLNLFVAVGLNDNDALDDGFRFSDDGIIWTQAALPNTNLFRSVIWVAELDYLVAVGQLNEGTNGANVLTGVCSD